MAGATVPLNFIAFLEKAKLKDDGSNYTIAIRPEWIKSLCISVIPGSVMLTHTVLEDL